MTISDRCQARIVTRAEANVQRQSLGQSNQTLAGDFRMTLAEPAIGQVLSNPEVKPEARV